MLLYLIKGHYWIYVFKKLQKLERIINNEHLEHSFSSAGAQIGLWFWFPKLRTGSENPPLVVLNGQKRTETWSTSVAITDTDELVAVAEGILGQRVTGEGFLGKGGVAGAGAGAGVGGCVCVCGGGWREAATAEEEEVEGGRWCWWCPVRRVIWGVQSEAVHQQLSLEQQSMAHVPLWVPLRDRFPLSEPSAWTISCLGALFQINWPQSKKHRDVFLFIFFFFFFFFCVDVRAVPTDRLLASLIFDGKDDKSRRSGSLVCLCVCVFHPM